MKYKFKLDITATYEDNLSTKFLEEEGLDAALDAIIGRGENRNTGNAEYYGHSNDSITDIGGGFSHVKTDISAEYTTEQEGKSLDECRQKAIDTLKDPLSVGKFAYSNFSNMRYKIIGEELTKAPIQDFEQFLEHMTESRERSNNICADGTNLIVDGLRVVAELTDASAGEFAAYFFKCDKSLPAEVKFNFIPQRFDGKPITAVEYLEKQDGSFMGMETALTLDEICLLVRDVSLNAKRNRSILAADGKEITIGEIYDSVTKDDKTKSRKAEIDR